MGEDDEHMTITSLSNHVSSFYHLYHVSHVSHVLHVPHVSHVHIEIHVYAIAEVLFH